jgi:ABC-2 type transport system permease protein
LPGFSAIGRKTRYHFINTGRILREQSLFKCIFIAIFAIVLEGGLCLLFLDGFEFLDSFSGIGSIIVSRLFSVFFFGMSCMLVMSSIVTSYVTIFRSDEVRFLLVRPFAMSDIVVYKFFESAMLSSWAFFFIIVPFISAFALHAKLSPAIALWTLLFSVPFLVVCAGLGTVAVILLVRWFPRVRIFKALSILVALSICLSAWWFLRTVYNPDEEALFDIARLVPGLRMASCELLPSWWFAEGIMALSRGQWFRGTMLWGVLLSSAALVTVCVEWIGSASFYDIWQLVCGSKNRGNRTAVLFRRLERMLTPLAHDVRAMILKDIRIFCRDPMQWSQALVFFGLLGLYFANLRSFKYEALPEEWRSIISFLNVFSVSAVMCSLGSRFIYPQLSLEGQGFWILGLSPTSSKRILLTKFLLSLVTMTSVSGALILLSTEMLKSDPAARIASFALICSVSLAVCGLSCGLGAIFLDLRQKNPAAIVSGFGGTLNLVLSLAFLLAAILPFGIIFHLNFRAAITPTTMRHALLAAGAWLVIITSLTTAIPIAMGVRSLNNRDF